MMMQEVKKKSLSKNTIFKFLLNIFNLVVPVLIGPYVMRSLSTDQVGTLNYAQSIFGYFFIFASFGVYQYGVREISRVRKNKEKLEKVFSELFLITIITNILVGIVYFAWIRYGVSDLNLKFVCDLFTIYFFTNIFLIEWINEALENFDFITIKTIIVKSSYVLAVFIFVKSSDDFYVYISLIIASSALNNIISYIYIKRKIKFKLVKINPMKHIKPMFLVVILSNANILYTQLDRVMIGARIGMTTLSYYAISQGIMAIITNLMRSVVQVSIPRLNAYVENGLKEKYESLLKYISKIYLMLTFPAFMGLVCLAEEIMVLYGGNNYIGTGSVLVFFAIYMITLAFENIIGNQIMYIYRQEKEQVKILFMGGIINLILNCILVSMNIKSVEGYILTTIVANSFIIYRQKCYAKNKLNIDYKIINKEYIKYLMISCVFIPVIIVIKFISSNNLIRVLLSASVCGIIYGAILLVIKDEIALNILQKLKNKIKKLKN